MRGILTIVWAVLAAVLCWFAVTDKAPWIQQDILTRTTEAVKPLNANAEVTVDGRYVALRGPEPDIESKAKTLAAADNVDGALGPTDGLWVPGVANVLEFLTAEKKADGALVLTGLVPSDEARAAVETSAKAVFSGAIDNRIVVSGGNPSKLPDISSALKVLSGFDVGGLTATSERIRISGVAPTAEAADAAQALEAADPDLVQAFVEDPAGANAPAGAPGYLGVIKSPDGSITASGAVPTEDAHAALLEVLKTGNPDKVVNDRVVVQAQGLDAGWAERALAGAKALVGLDWGDFSLEGAKGYLRGMAPQEKIADLTEGFDDKWEAEVLVRKDDPDAARIAELEGKLSSLGTELDAAKKAVADGGGNAEAAAAALAAAKKLAAEEKAKADAITGELEAAKKAAADADGKAQSAIADLDAAHKQEAETKAKSDALAGELDAAKRRIDDLVAQLAAKAATPAPEPAPAPSPAPAPAPATPQDTLAVCNKAVAAILRDATVEFDTAKATIRPEGVQLIDRLIAAAEPCKNNADLRVTIGGHTDSQGEEPKNLRLSRERAEAVKAVLVSRGIAADSVTAIGFGESMPIADNSTAEGRQANRRITIEWSLR